MKELEKNNNLDWTIQTECLGNTVDKTSCGKLWEVNAQDIEKRILVVDGCPLPIYGFVCPNCKNFTELSYRMLPEEVIRYCERKTQEARENNKRKERKGLKSLWPFNKKQ